jgi:quercetin dioxygenase-like cupin family protein
MATDPGIVVVGPGRERAAEGASRQTVETVVAGEGYTEWGTEPGERELVHGGECFHLPPGWVHRVPLPARGWNLTSRRVRRERRRHSTAES